MQKRIIALDIGDKRIGVAVSTRPEGPYTDALGHPLLTNKDCFASSHSWACIDPTVMIDDDGQAWLFWGNGKCYAVRLKRNILFPIQERRAKLSNLPNWPIT